MKDIPQSAVAAAYLVGPARLSIRNGRLLYTAQDGSRAALDLERLREVALFGSVGLSHEAAAALYARNVSLCWFSADGLRLRARMVPADSPTVLRRLRQYRLLLCPSLRVPFARQLVAQRIGSLIPLARHHQRHGHSPAGATLKQLYALKARLPRCRTMAAIRGIEGAATRCWFELFGQLLRPPWTFPGRRRRPPTDPVNALLSLAATLLTRRAVARVEADGLEPALGTLHAFRPGRPSLACDLVEPLRAIFVERFTLQICNRNTLRYTDFVSDPHSGGVRLKPNVFPRALARWDEQYHNASGPQRLGKLLADYRRQLAQVRLPRTVEGFDPPANWAAAQGSAPEKVAADGRRGAAPSEANDERHRGDVGERSS